MFCRRLTAKDTTTDNFRNLVRTGLYSRDLGIPVDEAKLFALCEATTKYPHFSAVATEGEKFVAYIGAISGEHYWYQRQQMNVIGWFSLHPFAGMRLLDMALDWARDAVFISSVMVTVNPDSAEKVRHVLLRRASRFRTKKMVVHVVPSFLIEV